MSILDIFSCVPERELSCAKIEEIAVSLEKGDYCRREEFPVFFCIGELKPVPFLFSVDKNGLFE